MHAVRQIWVNPMLCPAPSEVNYPSIIIPIDKDIVRLCITPYYPNIVKFLDGVFDLACPFFPPRKCDGVDVNQTESRSVWIRRDVGQKNPQDTVIP